MADIQVVFDDLARLSGRHLENSDVFLGLVGVVHPGRCDAGGWPSTASLARFEGRLADGLNHLAGGHADLAAAASRALARYEALESE